MGDSTYRRCPNCGNLYTPDQSETEYCSEACGERFERCTTCGSYYLFGTGISAGVCSDECTKCYTLAKGKKDTYVLSEETV